MNLNNAVKGKQKLLLGVGMAVVMAVAMGVVFVKKNSSPTFEPVNTADEEIIIERYSGIGSNVEEDEIWRATSSNEIDELKKENAELKRDLKDFKSSISEQVEQAVKEKTSDIESRIEKGSNARLDRIQSDLSQRAKQYTARPPEVQKKPSPEAKTVMTPVNEITVTRRAFERTNPNVSNPDIANYRGDDLVKGRESKLHSLSFAVEVKTEQSIEEVVQESINSPEAVSSRGKTVENYIPSGTFVRAVLLGGVDAPTGGQAQNDPYPVLMQIDDIAQLPNSFQYDFTQCRVIGAGHGDLSSERAVIRLEKLSCVTSSGEILESRIKGFVYDETGKAGIRGRLVSKQGQLIANGLLAGIAGGIGGAFQNSSTNFSTNALGTQTQGFDSAKDSAIAGMGKGVGNAFDRLSQYFIDLAEQIFPVIEVDAGRMVDIVFTSGFRLKKGSTISADNDTSFAQTAEEQPLDGGMTIGDIVQGTGQAMQAVQGLLPAAPQSNY